jgi:hypothetical protein
VPPEATGFVLFFALARRLFVARARARAKGSRRPDRRAGLYHGVPGGATCHGNVHEWIPRSRGQYHAGSLMPVAWLIRIELVGGLV